MEPVIWDKLLIDMAAGDTSPGTTSPALHGASIGLYGIEINLNTAMTKGDIDANSMTFGGYAPHGIDWGPVTLGEDAAIEVLGAVDQWNPTGSDSTQLAFGFYVWNHAGAMLFAAQFDGAPLNMGSPLNVIQITLRHRPNATEPINIIS